MKRIAGFVLWSAEADCGIGLLFSSHPVADEQGSAQDLYNWAVVRCCTVAALLFWLHNCCTVDFPTGGGPVTVGRPAQLISDALADCILSLPVHLGVALARSLLHVVCDTCCCFKVMLSLSAMST
eukprot:GHUV01014824.1.p1 GENE.GHUV01014824.1~~GHUV01014824.1.p1  ORF type:complete len:125 (-),score=8.74 GHUV01014824.1:2146-2520(-)